MSLRCKFLMPNEEYSEDYAKENHDGEESEENYRILWEDEFDFTGAIESVELSDQNAYSIHGEKDGESFEISIPNMIIWTIKGETINQIAVSKNAIDSVEFDNENFCLVFKEMSVLTNVIPGVYIDVSDFPKELIS